MSGRALIGVILPGRFDDAVRVAVVRRYPGCPAGVRSLCFSLVTGGAVVFGAVVWRLALSLVAATAPA